MSSVGEAERLVLRLQEEVKKLLDGLQRHLGAGDLAAFADDVIRLKYLLKVL